MKLDREVLENKQGRVFGLMTPEEQGMFKEAAMP